MNGIISVPRHRVLEDKRQREPPFPWHRFPPGTDDKGWIFTCLFVLCAWGICLDWFDGEESEVHTLEPNDHKRSQHWQKQPSPASPAFCNPWA